MEMLFADLATAQEMLKSATAKYEALAAQAAIGAAIGGGAVDAGVGLTPKLWDSIALLNLMREANMTRAALAQEEFAKATELADHSNVLAEVAAALRPRPCSESDTASEPLSSDYDLYETYAECGYYSADSDDYFEAVPASFEEFSKRQRKCQKAKFHALSKKAGTKVKYHALEASEAQIRRKKQQHRQKAQLSQRYEKVRTVVGHAVKPAGFDAVEVTKKARDQGKAQVLPEATAAVVVVAAVADQPAPAPAPVQIQTPSEETCSSFGLSDGCDTQSWSCGSVSDRPLDSPVERYPGLADLLLEQFDHPVHRLIPLKDRKKQKGKPFLGRKVSRKTLAHAEKARMASKEIHRSTRLACR